ncbi:MAG: TlpA disulfide reductase family protein [Bacteroidales bacterium]
MKKYFYLLLIALFAFACKPTQKEAGFTIRGSIENLPAGDAFLLKSVDGKRQVVDTARVDSTGSFVFEGQVEAPEMVFIQVSDTLSPLMVFVENMEISITGKYDALRDAVVCGSKTHDEYKAYRDTVKSLFSEREKAFQMAYKAARTAKNDAEVEKVVAGWDSLDNEMAVFAESFVKAHPSSFITPAIIWNEMSYSKEGDELESLVANLDSSLNKSIYVKLLNDRITLLKKTAIGQPAIDFTMNAPDGTPVTLSSHYGKYLLVDFWASWCGPCRMENPNVVAAWKEFNKKGFDVFGVSLDRDSAKWVAAIKDDKLSWTHVSDLKFWENAAAGMYGVRSIPANFLLDKNGIIIAKNLRGDDLKAKLAELLK